MYENSNEILDQETTVPEKRYHALRSVGYLLIFAGIIFRVQHWPFSTFLFFWGVALWLVYAVLRTVQSQQSSRTQWAYFIGKVGLMLFLGMRFFHIHDGAYLALAVAVLAFAVGAFSSAKNDF